MTDVLVPNFRKRKAAGEVFFNPMTRTTEQVEFNDGIGPTLKYTATASCGSPVLYREVYWDSISAALWSSSVGGEPLTFKPPLEFILSSSEMASAQTEASTAAWSQQGRGGAQGTFENIAEYKQSLESIRQIYHAGNKHVGDFLSSFPKNSRKIRPADCYLLYRYGIKPLVQDTVELLDQLTKSVGKQRITSRGYANLRKSGATSAVSTEYGWCNVNVTKQTSDSYELRAMILDEVVVDQMFRAGLTGKNLLTLPWELIPYSFVADWFVNLGDIIGAAVPVVGNNTLGSALVATRTVKTVTSAVPNGTVGAPGYTVLNHGSGSATRTVTSKVRGGLMPPGIVVRADFGFDRDTRVADAVALLAQKFQRRPELKLAMHVMQSAMMLGQLAKF